MSNRIVVRERLFIPKHLVNARRLKALYTKRFYEESKCVRCPYLGERHSEHCDGCPNYLGRLQMYREGERRGTPVYELPAGDLPTISEQLNIDLSGVRDLRCRRPLRHRLVWKGQLRRGEVVDGSATANQVKLVRQWLAKRRNGIIKCPPRTGKTVIMTYLSVQLGMTTLILAHQEELLKNFLKTYLRDTNLRSLRRRTGNQIVAIVKKDSDFGDTDGKGLDVALCTYQMFIRAVTGEARIKKYLVRKYGLLGCDEAHQSPATAYSRVVNELDVSIRVALTATPIRKDGMSVLLERMFGPVQVESKSVALVPELKIWETEVRAPHSKGFKLWAYAMRYLFNSVDRNHQIVRQVFTDLRAGHRCIVIPVDQIAHIKELVRLINHQAGINRQKRGETWARQLAVELHGKSPRDAILKAVEAGKHAVLVANRSMVKQGIDLKAPTCLYVAVPMSNPSMFRQLAWRVGTPQEGKIQPIVRVMVDRMVQSSACFRSLFNNEIRANIKASDDGPASYKMNDEEAALARSIAGDRQYHLRAKKTGEAPRKMGKAKGQAAPAEKQSGFAHLSKSKGPTTVRGATAPRKHAVRLPAKISNQLAKW